MVDLWWYLGVGIVTALGAYGLWRAYLRERVGLFFACAAALSASGIAFGVRRQVYGPGADLVHILAFLLGLVAFASLIGAADRRHGGAVAAWALALWIAGAIFGAVRVPERDGDPDAPENLGVPSRYS